MTRDQAIATTARWWADMMIAQVWDNGDPASEATHAMFRATQMFPIERDRSALEAALRDAASALDWSTGLHRGWYCDYHAAWLDNVLQAVNPAWDSHFCGPQKAGTQFEVSEAGEVTVLAKCGYGQPWTPLEPAVETQRETQEVPLGEE